MTTERTTEQIKTSDPTKKYQKMTTATDPTTGINIITKEFNHDNTKAQDRYT